MITLIVEKAKPGAPIEGRQEEPAGGVVELRLDGDAEQVQEAILTLVVTDPQLFERLAIGTLVDLAIEVRLDSAPATTDESVTDSPGDRPEEDHDAIP